MASKQPAWTEDREAQLVELVGTDTPVSIETVATIAEEMGNSTRSIASKLRKMDYVVQKVDEKAKSFSDKEEEALIAFVTSNPGMHTFKEIAEQVMGTVDYAKKVQGKLLSLELTDKVKKADPVVVAKKYTEAEEEVIVGMAKAGAYLEEIADKLGKEVGSVRGKCLSMLKSHGITYPKLKNKADTTNTDVLAEVENIDGMTVAEIATAIGKTERGVKTMLTHRGIDCANYKGATKAAKNAEKKATASA